MDATTNPGDMQQYIIKVREHNAALQIRTGHQPAACLRTFGCQQNVSDSEKIKGMLAEMGYTFTDEVRDAALILFNTCAVRKNAEHRIYGNVGALKSLKEASPGLMIGLCGCMTQQQHVADKIKESYPHVGLVFGTHALPTLPKLLVGCIEGAGRVFSIGDGNIEGEIAEGLPTYRENGVKAFVPVMYGCDNFCSFCVVPLVRGRERSRERRAILDEISGLIAEGYKEFTLLGQNVNSYGKTLTEPVDFAALLREINALSGNFRIRFMTSHPKDCTTGLIDAIAQCDKVMRHIHLPVQSGSNRILAAMNRGYTAEKYLELIEYARRSIPDITFTSDVMVGFPGETREDFQDTLALVRRVGFQSLFTFVFSSRTGTAAADMDDPVPKEEKMRWFQELLDAQAEIGQSKHDALIGGTLRVLAEGPGKTGNNMLQGRSASNIIVEFPGKETDVGQFANIRIAKAMNWALAGEKTEDNNGYD